MRLLAASWLCGLSLGLSACFSSKPEAEFILTESALLSLSFAHHQPGALLGGLYNGGSYWNLNVQEPIYIWNHQSQLVSDIVASRISHDDRFAVTAEPYTWVHWSLATGEATGFWHSNARIHDIALSGDGLFVGLALNDASIRLVDARAGILLTTLRHQGPVRSLAFSQDGQWLISGSEDFSARLWSTQDGEQALRIDHRNQVTHVNISDSGRLGLTVSPGDDTSVWDLESRRKLWDLNTRRSAVSSSLFIGERYLLLGTRTHLVLLYDLQTGNIVQQWRLPSQTFGRYRSQEVMALGALGNHLWAGSSDGRIFYLQELL